jgi:trigger factor
MQSEVINLSGLSRKMKVTVPPELIKDEFNKRISELAKKANIKGFRKGKVPTTVVKLQYGDAVRQEVIQDVLWQTLQQAFKEQNLYPAGTPEIELKNIKEDAPFEYEASFEVYPEVRLDLQGISVERPVSEVTDQHVTDVIAKLRKQNTKWSEVERGAEKGDLLVIDFEGFIDDVKFEGGSANNFQLELGGGQMIPGFEDSLFGAKKDDDVLVNVTFPEDYHAPEAAGKPAKFKIKIQKVSEPQLPEVNDDFAKDLGVSDGTIEGLSKEVRQNLERELTKRIHDRIKEQIINAVIENNSVEVPQTLIDKEAARLQQQFQNNGQCKRVKKMLRRFLLTNLKNKVAKMSF